MSLANQHMSKKKEIIVALFRHCRSKGNFEFNKDLIKEEAKKIGFGNSYDVPKVDQSSILPEEVRDDGYCIALLGTWTLQVYKGIGYLVSPI